ncbi:hypothetical protein U1Q18_030042 [Sarracenia purpurea var. burkii]
MIDESCKASFTRRRAIVATRANRFGNGDRRLAGLEEPSFLGRRRSKGEMAEGTRSQGLRENSEKHGKAIEDIKQLLANMGTMGNN